jgi:hypothetical protein
MWCSTQQHSAAHSGTVQHEASLSALTVQLLAVGMVRGDAHCGVAVGWRVR